ncbi:hypothetical protein SAMN05216251_105371 [Actinacidiphila alni]|uniref:Uncharacterized protein n=1 Tax=Actinacidiphila alni TaxID=380248 RepID=A0A1I2DS35_9ACTN|nr:hypothetical protein [Actinacidiphila alni]SFE83307.1 hypothetical protein SAMN05216251_105371 [Actinacidiphila alni]
MRRPTHPARRTPYATSPAPYAARPVPYRVLAAVLLAALPLLGGCGIRTTTVPVDAGPAPSRVSCAVPPIGEASQADAVVRQVYLVCSSQTAPIKRSVALRQGRFDRLSQVRELLAQLQRSPLSAEARAGFSTEVPGSLEIAGPYRDDPKETLRLNQAVDELPSFALAQIVCTLAADTSVSADGTVVLAGDDPDTAPRRYSCTADLRSRGDAADSAGTAVG